MTYYLLLTAFTVSIDSFACGFALAYQKGKKYLIILGIFITVLLLCTCANCLTSFFGEYINENTSCASGLILVGVGLFNLFKKENTLINNSSLFKQSLITGVAVGIDGAVANISLNLMGYNAFYVPLTIALMHAVMISLGVILAQTTFKNIFDKINFLPSLILIILGAYKLLGFFI